MAKKTSVGGGRRRPENKKRVTRYDYADVTEPRTPETGHTPLLGDEHIVTMPMDGQRWSSSLDVVRLADDGDRSVIVDMDPAVDPVLLWSGKRNRREIPVLPLQRNEVVAESRIARIVERARGAASQAPKSGQTSLFADLERELRETDKAKRIEFYTHDEGWKNKLICGDSLPVMESLLEYEGLRGRVQMIYVDPPYGVGYNSNFQQRVDSAKNEPDDAADDVLTIKAFRDSWVLGIHSYLSYLMDRLYLCRELLAPGGSIFVQMGDENVHLVRAMLDEVFSRENFVAQIAFAKTAAFSSELLSRSYDHLLWYARNRAELRYRTVWTPKRERTEGGTYNWVEDPTGAVRRLTAQELRGDVAAPEGRRFRADTIVSPGETKRGSPSIEFDGRRFDPSPGTHWKTTAEGMRRLVELRRVVAVGRVLAYKRFEDDFPYMPFTNVWDDTIIGTFSEKLFVVQTSPITIERCMLMATDPGDLVLDPTCGSGTTAYVAERLGRRWVTCDTSRVALNVARQRLLSAVYDHFRTRGAQVSSGFIYRTAPHVTLKSLAYDMEPEQVDLVNRPEIDRDAIRVTGPFEVATVGRYSVDDWKGYVSGEGADAGKLENYIAVICRLYRRDAALAPSGGLLHAIVDEGRNSMGISVGPISGRVTPRQIHEAVKEAAQSGVAEVHVLGWAFETNVNEVTEKLEREEHVGVRLVMIRPDSLAEGLKVTQPEMLFSPLAVPDVDVNDAADRFIVTLKGVAVFDRKKRVTEYKPISSGYVAAWYLDEDYDGDCFVDSQMFFDFKRKPAIERSLGIQVEPEEWALRARSDPFAAGRYKRVAVKVVDVFGNESTVVKRLTDG